MRNKREVAVEAILSAGALIKETFGREIRGEVEEKDRNDFVTSTDRLSEKMITETLTRSFKDIGVLAEESGMKREEEEFWIIDPLDGTTNFIHGYPSIGVSIALVQRREVVLGMVYDPLREELFEAVRGGGAFRNGMPIRVSAARSLSESLLGTGFPFKVYQHLDSYLEVFKYLFLRCRGIRRAGAAVLDLCYVAAGRLDGFWELYLKPWDMAAGSLIVREAGGRVSDFFGGEDFLSAGNIVAGPASVHRDIVEATSRVFRREDIAELANSLI
ncbi:MAG: inositol monophosphatase [Candidatus Krumholzibacteriota bacterium]|nr:inositol monophosphatase [Candidatus Krumholzibacteriota bacterium]